LVSVQLEQGVRRGEGISDQRQPLQFIVKVIIDAGWILVLEIRPDVLVIDYEVYLAIG